MALDYAGSGHHHIPYVLLGDDFAIGENPRRVPRDLVPRARDEDGHAERRQRIEYRVAEADTDERGDDGERGEHIARRMLRIGEEDLARQALAGATLVPNDRDVDRQRSEHDGKARDRDL